VEVDDAIAIAGRHVFQFTSESESVIESIAIDGLVQVNKGF